MHGRAKSRHPNSRRPHCASDGAEHMGWHMSFGMCEMMWQPFTCWAASELGLREERHVRIRERQNKVDDNAGDMHRLLGEVIAVAITSYFLLDVKKPEPALLLRNRKSWKAQVCHAGGIILHAEMKYHALPILGHRYATRSSEFDRMLGWYAFMFHLSRSETHKPNYVDVALGHLVNYSSASPAIKQLMRHVSTINVLRRPGASINPDKCCEWLNNFVGNSHGVGGDYSRRTHTGPELMALLHVCASHDELRHGGTGARDPIRGEILNGANLLRKLLVQKCGTDLTVPTAVNPFWHTGQAAPIDTPGCERERKPWKSIWKVAHGLTGGKGPPGRARLRPQTWTMYVDGRIKGGRSNMFSGMRWQDAENVE